MRITLKNGENETAVDDNLTIAEITFANPVPFGLLKDN